MMVRVMSGSVVTVEVMRMVVLLLHQLVLQSEYEMQVFVIPPPLLFTLPPGFLERIGPAPRGAPGKGSSSWCESDRGDCLALGFPAPRGQAVAAPRRTRFPKPQVDDDGT